MSPLYVFSSTFAEPPSSEDVVMALSVILWSITIMVTLKYVFIILHADNEGEGGTFSCYSLLTRYVRPPVPPSPTSNKRHTDTPRPTSRTATRAKK